MSRRHLAAQAALAAIAATPALLGLSGLAGLPLAAFIVPGGVGGGGLGDVVIGSPHWGEPGLYIVRGPGLVGGLTQALEQEEAPGVRVYSVLATLPLEVWVPLIVAVASLPLLYALAGRRARGGLAVPLAVPLLFAVVSLSLASSVLVPEHVLEGAGLPRVSLESLSHDPINGMVTLTYSVEGTFIAGVSACVVEAGVPLNCTATVHPPDVVIVGVPLEAYEALYSIAWREVSSMTLRLNLSLDKGWASGSYKLTVAWRGLRFYADRWRLVVENPNPIPFTLKDVSIHYIRARGGAGPQLVEVDYVGDIDVPPGSVVAIPVEPGDWSAYVTFRYEYRFAEGGVVEASVGVG